MRQGKERRKIRSLLEMWKLDKQIDERKKNCLDCLQSMPSEGAPILLLYFRTIGRRDPGWPRRRWLDV
jgi:hypothetical protein